MIINWTRAVIELKLVSAANPVTPLPGACTLMVLTINSAKGSKVPGERECHIIPMKFKKIAAISTFGENRSK